MSSFFNCAAYDDLETTIRLRNPFQVRVLAKYLTIALSQMKFSGLAAENHFGDLTVQIEQENLPEENFMEEEYAWAVPF